MRAGSATAMISAAALLAPGCGSADRPGPGKADPLRRATFKALAAQAMLLSCTGAEARRETRFQQGRLEELGQLALRKGAGQPLGLAQNDWAAAARFDRRPRCGAGEAAYQDALSAFSAHLDAMAGAIAVRQQPTD